VAEVSNEMLMAYADGVLDPLNQAVVERALEAHPEYREIVEKFRATSGPIRRVFLDAPGQDRLEALSKSILSGYKPLAASTAPADWGAIVRSRGKAFALSTLQRGRAAPVVLAASVALMFGTMLGWWLHTEAPRGHPQNLVAFGERGLVAHDTLRQVLETTSSGTPITTKFADGKSWVLKASYTFRAFNDSFCRRYEISRESDVRFDGYACRGNDGLWIVQAQAQLDGGPSNAKGFTPAAGSGNVEVDAAISTVMAGDVFEAGQEAKLLARSWAVDR
jgi:hypothetical protein